MTSHDHSLYSAAGPISYVDILKAGDGRSRGCGTVIFETESAAEKAICELGGQNIIVEGEYRDGRGKIS